jgi:TRAP-type mannitol/chloroaromatic compound transport system substrate-binding protein
MGNGCGVGARGAAHGEALMDRRDFLKVGGAAAVTAGSAGAATARPAPTILPGATELRLASPDLPDVPSLAPDRLARRIELATGGRYRIIAEPDTSAADLVFGNVNRRRDQHPAFAFFAGLPLGQGLDAPTQQTWLAVGGGQMLWDDLAGRFGFKPLIAGHTGPSGGLWATRRLETASDLSGARVHVDGLAADVVRALGAVPTRLMVGDLRAGLAEGRIEAAELLAPLVLAAPDLQPLAQRLYNPGLNAGGAVLSLDVRRQIWDGLSVADQAILEACAAEAHMQGLAEAQAHDLMATQIASTTKWPVKSTLGAQLSASLHRAAGKVLAELAGHDPDARRIHDSYQAFRAMLDPTPPTA